MYIKRKNISCYKYFLTGFWLLVFHFKLGAQVIDSIWAKNGDTLVLVHKPVELKEKIVVYTPKPKKIRTPLPRDNHFFMNLFINTYVDYREYYDVDPNAQEYIDKLNLNTWDGVPYGGYGVGLGYYTNRWILDFSAMMFGFQERRVSDFVKGSGISRNGYYYVGTRLAMGYRLGQNKLIVFPKFEFGLNFYDRTDGKLIDPKDHSNLIAADHGIVNDVAKFRRQVKTLGPAIKVCYKFNDNYLFYLEPFYNYDIDDNIKSNELFSMRRKYWGLRVGVMFYFF